MLFEGNPAIGARYFDKKLGVLEEGAADLIGVGRAIFKDADWAKKEMEE